MSHIVDYYFLHNVNIFHIYIIIYNSFTNPVDWLLSHLLSSAFSKAASHALSSKESHPRQKISCISLTWDTGTSAWVPFCPSFSPFRCPTRADASPSPHRSPLGTFIFHTLLIRKWWCSGRWRVPVTEAGGSVPGTGKGRKVVFTWGGGGNRGDRTLARGSHD